jgi:hypothetical protein
MSIPNHRLLIVFDPVFCSVTEIVLVSPTVADVGLKPLYDTLDVIAVTVTLRLTVELPAYPDLVAGPKMIVYVPAVALPGTV